ncbi:MAG: DNA repair protein RecN, partial [Candidatus Latescibacteria bacterium]|nr:DNA repair protein RecN [Candidatus Latescibacterota bacterium]
EVIRTGEKKCMVEAIFQLYPEHPGLGSLEEMGIETDGGELILRREVLAEGRSRCFANGLAIPVRALHDLGRALVDLHGQHDHQSLLDAEQHLDFLDDFGGLRTVRKEVKEAYNQVVRLQNRMVEKTAVAQRQRERRELLEFQVKEISEVAPQSGEDEQLAQELSVLSHAERLIEIAVQLENVLYEGENSVADQLGIAAQLMDEATKMDRSLDAFVEDLNGLRYGAEELARAFGDYASRVEHNPERLVEVTERLETLNALKKKYGNDLNGVLSYRKKAEEELALSDELEASLEAIQIEIDAAMTKFSASCQKLSKGRQKAAGKLSKGIREALQELGMPSVKFEVNLDRRVHPEGLIECDGQRFEAGPRGMERGEFFLSTNPGEAVRPLMKVASGGEISRIMLAMKTVLAHTGSVQVLIFDEIDIGISGRIAEVVGKKLSGLSDAYQTISITHLPQIAKMADLHFSVRKETVKRRTVTRVVSLDEDGRAEELALMMGGEEISELTMQHAREMLAEKQ